MRQIEFFYFFGCAYAYLSVMRIGQMAAQAGVQVHWRPFNVRPLMAENNVALRTQKAKVKYMWRDVERRAASHGLPYLRSPIWPTDADLLANRVGIVAGEEGWIEPYTVASFKAWFLEALPLGTSESLQNILGRLGQDTERIIAKASSPAVQARFEAETEAARSFGVFGSPSFVVDGELFWGDDRLEEAIAWASKSHRLHQLHSTSEEGQRHA